MSERRLKLGHRKEYKRKSKHTRNPSYYPRHLTKVTLADFDADFNLRVSKEVAAQRGYGRKVLDKSCHIAWDHGYGYVKESRIVKFIAKYVGKPYKELAKAWNEWIKPIKNTDKTEYLDDYFTDYRWRQAFFRVDDNGLVQSVEQVVDITLAPSNGRRTGIMLCPSLVRLLNLIKQQTIMITVMDLPILILTPMEQTLTFIDRGC